jgi:predicted PurR-regulated permease PerM
MAAIRCGDAAFYASGSPALRSARVRRLLGTRHLSPTPGTQKAGIRRRALTDCAPNHGMPMDIRHAHLNTASYLIAAAMLLAILLLHLLPGLLAGLLVFSLIHALAPLLQRHLPGARAHWLVVALLGCVVVGLLTIAIVSFVAFLRSEAGNPAQLLEGNRVIELLDRAREQLPAFVVNHLPDNIYELRSIVFNWLGQHADRLQLAGTKAGKGVVHLLIGMILGAMVALHTARPSLRRGPLLGVLATRSANLAIAFRNIVFAQVKISAINTLFTAIFLLIVLPLFGVNLPFAKTLVIVTFVVGLVPVIGNLISNSIIFVVGLTVSLWVALAALGFLIVIHKFEYFLNARIVGGRIRARAWEILIAMLLMEAAFGIAGLIAAPIYYAYLKRELEAAKLI